jgi:hypothetical protein
MMALFKGNKVKISIAILFCLIGVAGIIWFANFYKPSKMQFKIFRFWGGG